MCQAASTLVNSKCAIFFIQAIFMQGGLLLLKTSTKMKPLLFN